MESSNCDTCAYNVYDEDDACYYCEANMDEDDAVRMMERQYRACPFYAHGRPKEICQQKLTDARRASRGRWFFPT